IWPGAARRSAVRRAGRRRAVPGAAARRADPWAAGRRAVPQSGRRGSRRREQRGECRPHRPQRTGHARDGGRGLLGAGSDYERGGPGRRAARSAPRRRAGAAPAADPARPAALSPPHLAGQIGRAAGSSDLCSSDLADVRNNEASADHTGLYEPGTNGTAAGAFSALDPTTNGAAQAVAQLDPARAAALARLERLTRFAPPPFLGSNSWAVAPAKTATGGALLANDPQMQFGIPALWHQVHLVLEGDFNAMGISVPGIPGIVFGRNEHIAWAITSLMADSQDLFIQRPNPENPKEFLYQGRWE